MSIYEQERNYLAAEAAILHREELATLDAVTVQPVRESYTFALGSDFVVVGTNPELADADNPTGRIIEERFFMTATDAEGHVYTFGNERSPAQAEIVFQHIAPAVEQWPHLRNVYGSQAYFQENSETDQLIRELDDELGPDWANHPEANRVWLF